MMNSNDPGLPVRKRLVGAIAVAAFVGFWICFAAIPITQFVGFAILASFAVVAAWVCTAWWIGLDSAWRRMPGVAWFLFALLACPIIFLFYLVVRAQTPNICPRCGNALTGPSGTCPACSAQRRPGGLGSAMNRVYVGLADSLTRGPVEKSKETAKHMAFALVGAFLLGRILAGFFPEPVRTLVFLMSALSAAAYWVLIPWWVYVDATWRKMDAMPWAVLALVTNVFGLVTYLVIRYPEPRACHKCGASLATGLKLCPYCGSEAEMTCPRCQSPVRPDWLYCPVCAAQIPAARAPEPAADQTHQTALVSVRGTVTDAASGAAIADAVVKVDAKSDGATTTTDPLGRFLMTGLEPRPYVLIASAEGYAQQSKGFTPSSATAQLHFSLRPVAQAAETQEGVSPEESAGS